MKKLVLLIGFSLLAFSGWAQTFTVQGHVRDLAQAGIPNQAVYINITPNALTNWDTVFTNAQGFYSISYTSAPSTQGSVLAMTNCGNSMDSLSGFFSPANLTVTLNLVCRGNNPPGTTGWLNGWVSPVAAGDTVDVSLYALRNGALVLDTVITRWDTIQAGLINYGFRLAPGNYFVKAELRAGSVNAGTYLATYYGQTTLQNQAAVVPVLAGASSNNVNITLLTTPSTNIFFVSGTINGFTPAVAAMDTMRVILIEINNNIWTPVDTMFATDSARNGAIMYWFRAPQAGTYSVLATLITGNAANYLPTYFGNVSTWSAASQFIFNPANLQRSANITLLPGGGTGGGGSRIRGGIFPGLPFVSTGGIAGIQVQLLDAQDNVLLATHSLTDGSYELGSLAFGTYKVRVEHLGLTSAVSTITLDAANPNADGVNFSISGNNVSTAVEEAELNVYAVYPNPAKGSVELRLSALSGQQRNITLRDLQGRIVSTLSVQLESGEQNIRFPLDGIAPGMYMLSVHGRVPSLHKLIVQ